jgi:hypothetical protein
LNYTTDLVGLSSKHTRKNTQRAIFSQKNRRIRRFPPPGSNIAAAISAATLPAAQTFESFQTSTPKQIYRPAAKAAKDINHVRQIAGTYYPQPCVRTQKSALPKEKIRKTQKSGGITRPAGLQKPNTNKTYFASF